MHFKMIKSIPIMACITMIACNAEITSEGDFIACTTVFAPALKVDVFDKNTGFPGACGVTVMLKDGDFFEKLTHAAADVCDESFTFSGAGEREGTYDITVTKEGYVDWYQYDVAVSSNLCHVNTVSLQAYLEK